jgi:glycosyltransferase involved in cell wall biosynthesis
VTRPLLVIAHEATRSGGNRVLHTLLGATRNQLGVPVAVELLAGGLMASQLRALATTSAPVGRPAAVLANSSVAAGSLLRFEADVPGAVYVHEDDEALTVLDARSEQALTQRCSLVMCVSTAAARALETLGVPAERIRIVPPVVTPVDPPDDRDVATARAAMGATATDRLVVACGEVAWHKGPDLFVDLVTRLSDDGTRFAWIGRRPLGLGRVVTGDLSCTGDSDRVVWTGEVPDAGPYLRAADVVVSTSRRDAQPLVPLEAALLGRPTAGFAVGGVAELGSEGCVAVVPYPDTVALADEVRSLLGDQRRSADLAAAGARRARERQSIEVVGALFVGELTKLLEVSP